MSMLTKGVPYVRCVVCPLPTWSWEILMNTVRFKFLNLGLSSQQDKIVAN